MEARTNSLEQPDGNVADNMGEEYIYLEVEYFELERWRAQTTDPTEEFVTHVVVQNIIDEEVKKLTAYNIASFLTELVEDNLFYTLQVVIDPDKGVKIPLHYLVGEFIADIIQ